MATGTIVGVVQDATARSYRTLESLPFTPRPNPVGAEAGGFKKKNYIGIA